MPDKILQLGDTLPNGALVIALRTKADMESCIVLALRTDSGNSDPYVTWHGSKFTGETIHGHYYDNITDAAADFVRRELL